MDSNYYVEQLHKIADLSQKSAEKREFFFQQILIVSTGTLGILLSLHTQQSESLYTRLVFLFAVLLLSLGSLTAGITFYDYSMLSERTRQSFQIEVEKALDEGREAQAVFVKKKRRTLFCENFSLIALILGLFTLFVYAVLFSFFS